MKDLKEKKAIVVGGIKEFQLAIAKGLLEYGAKVCILDYSSNLMSVVNELKKKGYQVEGLAVNLSDKKELEINFFKALALLDGEVDILINNIRYEKYMPSLDISIKDFQRVLEGNITSVFQLSQLAGSEMSKKNGGKIINVSSIFAMQGGYNDAAYSSSQGAVSQLTKSLSNEWAGKGINVNAIALGYFKVESNQTNLSNESEYKSTVSRIPIHRLGDPDEISGVIQFLSSKKSNYISGSVIPVDGGFTSR